MHVRRGGWCDACGGTGVNTGFTHIDVKVIEPAGPWSEPKPLRDLNSPEYLAIEKLAGYLTGVLRGELAAGMAHRTPMETVDLAIQIIESSRKLTVATYEALEPRLRQLIRQIADEER